MNRIIPLDWLRGLCAISIMIYHFALWMNPTDLLTNFLNKLGVYGVSTFFILSGLSMGIVYSNKIESVKDATSFFLKRLFRIAPLYFIACILGEIPKIIANGFDHWVQGWRVLFINVTLLFGFVSPGDYLVTGGWSIGNEMVFYALTPLILIAYDYKIYVGNVILLISFIPYFLISFYYLDVHQTLTSQWGTYINPFNNFFLYVVGVGVFYNSKTVVFPTKYSLLCISISFTIFYLLCYVDPIHIVTRYERLMYTFLCICLVYGVYKFKYEKKTCKIANYFEILGIATYGIYLLHPLVRIYLRYALGYLGINSTLVLFSLASILSIAVAILSYYYFESRVSLFGKKIIAKYMYPVNRN